MDKFLVDLSSPYWWISVVVVGLIINLMSNKLDAHLSKVSKWWAQQTAQRRKKRDQLVSDLKEDKSERVFILFDELRYIMYATILMVASLALFIFASYVNQEVAKDVLFILSCAALIPVFYLHQKILYINDIINCTRKFKV